MEGFHLRASLDLLLMFLGLMFGFGPSYRENRRFVIRHLRDFGFGAKSKMEVDFREELQYFIQGLDKVRERDGDNVCIHQIFKLSALNMLWRTLCGGRFSEEDEHVKYLIQRIEKTIAGISMGSQPKYAFPFLRHVPGLTDTEDQAEGIGLIQDLFRVIRHKLLCTTGLLGRAVVCDLQHFQFQTHLPSFRVPLPVNSPG
jgi:hypothetical protein